MSRAIHIHSLSFVIVFLLSSCAAEEQDRCADIQAKLQSCQPNSAVADGETCDATLLDNYDTIMSMSCAGEDGRADELNPIGGRLGGDGFGEDLLPFPSAPEPEEETEEYDYSELLLEFQLAIQDMSCTELDSIQLTLLDHLIAAETSEDMEYFQSFHNTVVSEMWYRGCME